MKRLNINKITKEEFLKIKEEDVIFITNPGRMGDEDGLTFIIKKEEDYFIYRVDGWMDPKIITKENTITFKDAINQFPKWHEAWQNGNNKKYQGKYKYLYMGFGNGLSVDKLVYNDFKPYLDEMVKEYLKEYSKKRKKEMQYAAIYNVWKKAFEKMISEKK